ncbi:quinone-dependent dihydroorotate dehydrogenase [Legionella dresdenensis]|uniref:Dihydroorotate dehydrogenase (quinone) n=1 Tax=Legionella dresdenensis TaxID=450200 RepID=A0ABV8CFK8_9GAMM
MYQLIKPLLFKLEPETAHAVAMTALNWLPDFVFRKVDTSQPVFVMGLQFPHRVSLAAGIDVNGDYLDGLAKLGFASIELGTVTPKPQSGNPLPRIFRIPQQQALINRMGFNNAGVDVLVKNIQNSRYRGILGINIGKGKDTALDNAAEDYCYCLNKVYEYASYITINISSPNTPDLRLLQQSDYLGTLLAQITAERTKLAERFNRHVPLVVKFSPDESNEALKQMAETVLQAGIEGIIATNTTRARTDIEQYPQAQQQGGMSGKPLFKRATECLQAIKSVVGDQVALIGLGGVSSADACREKIQAGASLVQVYTGLIYQGPGLVYKLTSSG